MSSISSSALCKSSASSSEKGLLEEIERLQKADTEHKKLLQWQSNVIGHLVEVLDDNDLSNVLDSPASLEGKSLRHSLREFGPESPAILWTGQLDDAVDVSFDGVLYPAFILDDEKRDLWYNIITLETRKKRCRQDVNELHQWKQDLADTMEEYRKINPEAEETIQYQALVAENGRNEDYRRALMRMIFELQAEQEYAMAKLSRIQKDLFKKHDILDYTDREDAIWTEKLRTLKYKSYSTSPAALEGLTPAFKEVMDDICKKDEDYLLWNLSFVGMPQPLDVPLSPPDSPETVKMLEK